MGRGAAGDVGWRGSPRHASPHLPSDSRQLSIPRACPGQRFQPLPGAFLIISPDCLHRGERGGMALRWASAQEGLRSGNW